MSATIFDHSLCNRSGFDVFVTFVEDLSLCEHIFIELV